MCNISICIVGGCYWDPQIRANPEKKIWGPLLCIVISYCVHALMQIVNFFHDFLHFFSLIVCVFSAYTVVLSIVSNFGKLERTYRLLFQVCMKTMYVNGKVTGMNTLTSVTMGQ